MKARRAIGVFLCVALLVTVGCAYSGDISIPRSGWNQILATEAIDRALKQLEWPDVADKTIYVQVGPPGDALDDGYLRHAVEVILADDGARIVGKLEEADHVLTCLVGAMGLDTGGRYVGFEGTSGGFIPITIPELLFYRKARREGFAKVEIALFNRPDGGVVHRSGPVQGTTKRVTTTILFVFSWSRSDTSRLE
jgi:hypothetical protein